MQLSLNCVSRRVRRRNFSQCSVSKPRHEMDKSAHQLANNFTPFIQVARKLRAAPLSSNREAKPLPVGIFNSLVNL